MARTKREGAVADEPIPVEPDEAQPPEGIVLEDDSVVDSSAAYPTPVAPEVVDELVAAVEAAELPPVEVVEVEEDADVFEAAVQGKAVVYVLTRGDLAQLAEEGFKVNHLAPADTCVAVVHGEQGTLEVGGSPVPTYHLAVLVPEVGIHWAIARQGRKPAEGVQLSDAGSFWVA